jgi:hypothetical protein
VSPVADPDKSGAERAVVADVGDQARALDIAGWLDTLERSARAGERLTSATRNRLSAAGARAAEEQVALPLVIDTWLTAGWVQWRALEADENAAEHGRLAGAMLRALDDGAKALADGYVREQQRAVRRDEGARATLLDWLLGGGSPDRVAEAAARLGLDIGGRRSVLVYGEVSEAILARLRESGALAAPRAGTIVAVVSGRPPRGPETAGLGRPGLGVAGIRTSYGEALRALDVARRLGLRGVVPYADVLPEALIGQDRATLRELVDATLGPLDGGRGGGASFEETIRAWLDEGLSVAATARRLDIHERTVRYRLARIQKLTGLDLHDPEDRFRLELAIRGRRLLGDGEAV